MYLIADLYVIIAEIATLSVSSTCCDESWMFRNSRLRMGLKPFAECCAQPTQTAQKWSKAPAGR